MNNSTRIVNRLMNLSSFIYTVENIKTFVEMNNTVHEKIMPVGSAIMVIRICVPPIDTIVHSSSRVFQMHIK